MDKSQVLAERDKVISQIKQYVPLFAPFLEINDSIREYSSALLDFEVTEIQRERQKLVRQVIAEKFKKLLGPSYSEDNLFDANQKLAFNIVDHHQVLNHPLLIGSNIIANVGKIFQDQPQKPIIVVSSGDVPPNNYFSKSGFQFQDVTVPLFSAKERESSTYFIAKRDFNFIERLHQTKRWSQFNKEQQAFLQQEQERVENLDFSTSLNYRDQVSVWVKDQWPRLFSEADRKNLPELLYITQEELTAKCLISLLKDQENFIYHTLFNSGFRQNVLDNFRGIVVAWRESEGKGTHFFWRKHPTEPRALRLFLQGDQLVPADARYSNLAIPLDPETIISLLEREEIYPSLFLIFSVLNFYAGAKPLTGYGSSVYLRFFRDAWIKTLQNTNFEAETKLVASVETTGLVGALPIFYKRISGKLKTLFAYDVIYNDGVDKDYLTKIFEMPFNDLLSVGIIELYDYFSQKYVPPDEKIKPKITFDDLAEQTFGYL